MALSSTIDKPSRGAAAIRSDRRIGIAAPVSGIAADLYRSWRREEAERAELRHADPKDLGYPAEFASRADMTAPSAAAKYGLLGFALLVGVLVLALVQQALLPGL
jgi:hypothetical protein